MTTIEDVMKYAREAGNMERRMCIGKAQGFDVRNAYNELRAAIEQYAAERVAEATAEWNKLRDPVTLHVSLLRGFPAQLDRATFLHIAGDEPPNVAISGPRSGSAA